MNENWVTSPAYMAVPGNIYNTILMDEEPRQECHPNQGNDFADVGLLICLVVFVVMWVVFFIGMSNEGK